MSLFFCPEACYADAIRIGWLATAQQPAVSRYDSRADTRFMELPSDGASPTFQSRPLLWQQLRVRGVSNPISDARKGAV